MKSGEISQQDWDKTPETIKALILQLKTEAKLRSCICLSKPIYKHLKKNNQERLQRCPEINFSRKLNRFKLKNSQNIIRLFWIE
jgi:hypothetical protein